MQALSESGNCMAELSLEELIGSKVSLYVWTRRLGHDKAVTFMCPKYMSTVDDVSM